MKPPRFQRHKDRQPNRGSGRPQPTGQRPNRPSRETGWDNVSGWYANYLEGTDTYQEAVVFPNTLRLLDARADNDYLDIACGEGAFAAGVVEAGARLTGVDAAPGLIETARRRHLPRAEFLIGDARHLPDALRGRRFAGATCILAIQNINDIKAVFREAARLLLPGAALVLVLNHPCFRIPRQSGWGWDEQKKLMYRRIDRYLTPLDVPIVMNPGGRGGRPVTTLSHHRPLGAYVAALAESGFAIDALEEWVSHRASDSGPRAKAENRARDEFPLFLGIRARLTEKLH